jgi:hypothetical protein
MKIIYIAGAYIGDSKTETIEYNIREAEKYAIALADREIGFFCPHKHTEHFHSGKKSSASEQFYYNLDFYFLTKIADAVLVVPDWENSLGTKKEVEWAKQNGLKIFYPKNPTDIEEVVKWARQ